MKKLLKEPIVLIIIIGGLFYLLNGWLTKKSIPEEKKIELSTSQIQQIAGQFSKTWMRQATDEELQALIKEHIRDEVYYREAMAMGLDKNDAVIRRRMRQKLEILLNDMAAARVPSNQVLTNFMNENEEKFSKDPVISFQQIYLNPDKRSDIKSDAISILEDLKNGKKSEELGDATMLGYAFNEYTQSEITRQFGEKFTQQIIKLRPGDWQGPVFSSMGVHIVKIDVFTSGKMPQLSEIRDKVEREWMAETSKELKDEAFEELLKDYEIVIEKTAEDDE